MKSNFAACANIVLSNEGGYVDNPADPGGPTNHGVTLATARALKIDINKDGETTAVDIKDLSEMDARAVFKAEYWDKCQCDALPLGLDLSVFDAAVNSGVHEAGLLLQHTLDSPSLTMDGIIGTKTLAAVASMPIGSLINNFNFWRLTYLKSLSTYSEFGPGWVKRVAAVYVDSEKMAALTTKPKTAVTAKRESFMDWLNSSVIAALVRNLAQWAAGILVTYGVIDSSQSATAAALIVGLVTVAWSFIAAHTKHNAVAVATAVQNGAPAATVTTLANKV